MKEGKRLIFPGLHSWSSQSRESVRNREKDMGTQALMEQRRLKINIVWAYILSYKVVILSKDKD